MQPATETTLEATDRTAWIAAQERTHGSLENAIAACRADGAWTALGWLDEEVARRKEAAEQPHETAARLQREADALDAKAGRLFEQASQFYSVARHREAAGQDFGSAFRTGKATESYAAELAEQAFNIRQEAVGYELRSIHGDKLLVAQ